MAEIHTYYIFSLTNKAGCRSQKKFELNWLKYSSSDKTKEFIEDSSWSLNSFCCLDISLTHWMITKKIFSLIGLEMAEILAVTNKAGYRGS